MRSLSLGVSKRAAHRKAHHSHLASRNRGNVPASSLALGGISMYGVMAKA